MVAAARACVLGGGGSSRAADAGAVGEQLLLDSIGNRHLRITEVGVDQPDDGRTVIGVDTILTEEAGLSAVMLYTATAGAFRAMALTEAICSCVRDWAVSDAAPTNISGPSVLTCLAHRSSISYLPEVISCLAAKRNAQRRRG